jgi:ribosome biogenesis protein ENP2
LPIFFNTNADPGTYKPQIHVHYLPHLALSFSRHTDALNQTFILLSSDYSKSLHLQSDRFLQFQTANGCHYSTRIPRYGRDLIYDKRLAEALVPAVGPNADGTGEVFRLNLELGRFMKGYEVDIGADESTLVDGALQGGVQAGSVNSAAVAEDSHNLLAFGTSLNTVEFWDSRSRSKVGILSLPPSRNFDGDSGEVTALKFHSSGLTLAAGESTGLIYLYDLRSPVPVLKKDQGYGYPIKTLSFLESSVSSRAQTSDPKVLSADKRIIKIWDQRDGTPWTSVEPAVDLNHVEWCRDSGMILTANEGRQQHAFFIPQLGPAPKWCAFLDNLVEEMAEDPNDPNAFGSKKAGEVYDNYKFLTAPQLRALNIDHLVGRTSLLRPYMHGYFVSQRLYEEASMISNPEFWHEQRAKSIKEKIDKERESRIRGKKKVQVKVNRKLVERMVAREEKHERRKAKRILARGGDDDVVDAVQPPEASGDEMEAEEKPQKPGLLTDPRFARLFEDEAFEIDEASREFHAINPSTQVEPQKFPKGLTIAEQEELEERKGSSSDSDSEDSEDDPDEGYKHPRRPQAQPQKKPARKSAPPRTQPQMVVSASNQKLQPQKDRSFGSRAAQLKDKRPVERGVSRSAVGEKEITFTPARKEKKQRQPEGHTRSDRRDRRNASGNTFRGM